MAAAKCQAGREKDLELLAYLFREKYLDPELASRRRFKVQMREAMIMRSPRALDEAIARAEQA